MVNSRTARRVEASLPGREVLFFRAVHCYSFLISFSSLSLNHLCFLPSILDLVCLAPDREHDANGSECRRTCKIMYIFQPLFFFCILHSIKQWTDFPQRNFIPKAEPSQPNDLFPVSICIFTSSGSFKDGFHQPALLPHLFFFIIAALLLLRLAIPRIPAHVSSPYLYVSSFSIIPNLPWLVWSCMADRMVVFFKAFNSNETSLQKTIFLFSDNVGCFIVYRADETGVKQTVS